MIMNTGFFRDPSVLGDTLAESELWSFPRLPGILSMTSRGYIDDDDRQMFVIAPLRDGLVTPHHRLRGRADSGGTV